MSSSHAPTVFIENIYPSIEAGRYPIKRIADEPLEVTADIFKDGHDILSASLKWRLQGSRRWIESPMVPLENDRWRGTCSFPAVGRWDYVVEAWCDTYRSWKHAFSARFKANDPDLPIEALDGARLLTEAAERAKSAGDSDVATQLADSASLLKTLPTADIIDLLLGDELQALIDRHPDRALSTISDSLPVIVERERARFSAWYEFFPRNALGRGDKHSTFRDGIARLDDAKAMGFDTIYFPPIHPIGKTARKGKNNTTTSIPGDVGSPWAIGAKAGGHKSIEPALGKMKDFEWLVGEAKKRGLEIALDFAINCSPDHPYVTEHPEWFHQRPDGSIRYAENPPKKYQDIYPLNFHCADWKNLWRELISVVLFWVDKGVRIFRVDNPHTKPVAFWEELITEVQRKDPNVIFLSEAFTRPKMMAALGKVGFSQSYTYFTWRESRQELLDYATELSRTEWRWFYRGNFWPNTPDILPHHLQGASPQVFRIRAALAAMLMPSWGIYSGFELCENAPLPGREEYLDSEKFQLVNRDWNAPGNIKGFISQLNRVRQENRALQLYDNVARHHADHDKIVVFSKSTPDFSNRILCTISLDPAVTAASLVHLDLAALGLDPAKPFQVTDLLHRDSYRWHGASNYVSLNPSAVSLHIFKVEQAG